jgi:hypothetical protein
VSEALLTPKLTAEGQMGENGYRDEGGEIGMGWQWVLGNGGKGNSIFHACNSLPSWQKKEREREKGNGECEEGKMERDPSISIHQSVSIRINLINLSIYQFINPSHLSCLIARILFHFSLIKLR